MKDMLKKMFQKKGQSEMRPEEKDAKMSVLKDLRGQAMDEMGSGLKNLKKASVVSDKPEGFKKGMDLAKELAEDNEEGSEHEALESPEMEASEDTSSEIYHKAMELSSDELEDEIAKLQALKEEKLRKEQGDSAPEGV